MGRRSEARFTNTFSDKITNKNNCSAPSGKKAGFMAIKHECKKTERNKNFPIIMRPDLFRGRRASYLLEGRKKKFDAEWEEEQNRKTFQYNFM